MNDLIERVFGHGELLSFHRRKGSLRRLAMTLPVSGRLGAGCRCDDFLRASETHMRRLFIKHRQRLLHASRVQFEVREDQLFQLRLPDGCLLFQRLDALFQLFPRLRSDARGFLAAIFPSPQSHLEQSGLLQLLLHSAHRYCTRFISFEHAFHLFVHVAIEECRGRLRLLYSAFIVPARCPSLLSLSPSNNLGKNLRHVNNE